MPDKTVAYFSMEIALEARVPTYSGGLGVLAGDMLRACADLQLPMVGVTLAHRKGYFSQQLSALGEQTESPSAWSPENAMEPLEPRVTVAIEGRPVHLRAWRYRVRGVGGHDVPVYLLDTDLPDNEAEDRALTDVLYGGDERHRLRQETVLGIGGVAMLRALGHVDLATYHMNEGHSALLAMALLEAQAGRRGLAGATEEDREAVRRRCVFTTHTPVSAGHDRFPMALVREVLGEELAGALPPEPDDPETLNMTHLALTFSRATNAVAMRHAQVSREMFPGYPIDSVTNGVHAGTWVCEPLQDLLDQHIPEWRADNLNLRSAAGIPLPAIRAAHEQARRRLIAEVELRTAKKLDPAAMTIGFARRATGYKRPDLLFSDHDRLRRTAKGAGPFQVVYAGKAHPRDIEGKAIITRVFQAAAALEDSISVVYLPEYDMEVARHLVAGADLWLNTPVRPLEASGTSGMKAAINGVPSLSTLDGWWIEGWVEGVTGWAIGDSYEELDASKDAANLYDKLERTILPLYHKQPDAYTNVMRSALELNGSFFNAQRMALQYATNVYGLLSAPEGPATESMTAPAHRYRLRSRSAT